MSEYFIKKLASYDGTKFLKISLAQSKKSPDFSQIWQTGEQSLNPIDPSQQDKSWDDTLFAYGRQITREESNALRTTLAFLKEISSKIDQGITGDYETYRTTLFTILKSKINDFSKNPRNINFLSLLEGTMNNFLNKKFRQNELAKSLKKFEQTINLKIKPAYPNLKDQGQKDSFVETCRLLFDSSYKDAGQLFEKLARRFPIDDSSGKTSGWTEEIHLKYEDSPNLYLGISDYQRALKEKFIDIIIPYIRKDDYSKWSRYTPGAGMGDVHREEGEEDSENLKKEFSNE